MIFDIVTKTPEQEALSLIKTNGNELFSIMVGAFKSSYDAVWNNPNSTPEKVVAAMGTEAVKIFTLSGALAAYLNGLQNGVVPTGIPTGYNYVANEDGSIVVAKI